MLVDTSFCVDLLRERRRNTQGPATMKLRNLDSVRLQMSLFVYGELQHGARGSADPEAELRRVEALAELVPMLMPDRSFAVWYGAAAARLQASGERIPQMDLLIGAHAASMGIPLLTRDVEHYRHIEGLVIESYQRVGMAG
jgi:predicted nucleic acid-binding protein